MFFSKRKQRKMETAPAAVSDDRTCLIADGGDTEKTEFYGGEDTPSTAFAITLTDLSGSGRTWTLPVAGELLVGRADHCAVQFYDQSVSREQFKIVARGGVLTVIQVGSTNQTKRNGRAVGPYETLRPGDMLQFGRACLRVDAIASQRPEQDREPEEDCVPCPPVQEDEDHTMSFF